MIWAEGKVMLVLENFCYLGKYSLKYKWVSRIYSQLYFICTHLTRTNTCARTHIFYVTNVESLLLFLFTLLYFDFFLALWLSDEYLIISMYYICVPICLCVSVYVRVILCGYCIVNMSVWGHMRLSTCLRMCVCASVRACA